MTDTTSDNTDTDDDIGDPNSASNSHMDELSYRWAAWCRSRRFYAPPPLGPGVLGKLTKKTRPARPGGPNAACSAELAALHLAITAQPKDNARAVFELHYLHAVANVKAAAAELGISRGHWYRLLTEFRARVYQAHHRILADNLAAVDALPHASTPVATETADLS